MLVILDWYNIHNNKKALLNALKNKIPFLVSNKFVACTDCLTVSLFSEVLNQVEINQKADEVFLSENHYRCPHMWSCNVLQKFKLSTKLLCA